MADHHFALYVKNFLKHCMVSTDFPRDNSLLIGGLVFTPIFLILGVAGKINYGVAVAGFSIALLVLVFGLVRNSWERILYPFDVSGVEDAVAQFSNEEINAFKRIMNYIEYGDTEACAHELRQLSRYEHMKEWKCAQILYKCFVEHKQKFSFKQEASVKNSMSRYPF